MFLNDIPYICYSVETSYIGINLCVICDESLRLHTTASAGEERLIANIETQVCIYHDELAGERIVGVDDRKYICWNTRPYFFLEFKVKIISYHGQNMHRSYFFAR